MDYKFYDTCSLLLKADNLFEDNEQFAISSITLNELEHIKTSNNKDPEIKCAARHLLKQLDQGGYNIVYFKEEYLKPIQEYGYEITNDMKILACAIHRQRSGYPDLIFVSNDIALRTLATAFFEGNHLDSVSDDQADDYTGYQEVYLSQEQMSEFYSNPQKNDFGILINQYIIIKDADTKEVVDQLCWTGEEFRQIKFKDFYSQ